LFASVLKGFARAPEATRDATLAASKLYYAALSVAGFDPAAAYVSLVCALECLAGHLYKGELFHFNEVQKYSSLKPTLEKIEKLRGGRELANTIKNQLISSEHFLFQKFKKLITEHLPESFWSEKDDLYRHNTAFPVIPIEKLGGCLRDVYDGRSAYVHTGKPFPSYIEFGLRDSVPVEVIGSLLRLRGKTRYLPPIAWFERVTHLVIVEVLLRAFAPESLQSRKVRLEEKKRILAVIAGLPKEVQGSLKKLTTWTAKSLGLAVINPYAPNKEWADRVKTVKALLEAGLIGCEGKGMKGKSWLKNRFVSEVVGEYFYGVGENPFRNNELLRPENDNEVS
jgi:hypothetical protein